MADTITPEPRETQSPPTADPVSTTNASPAPAEDVTSTDAVATPRFDFQEHLWPWKTGLRVITSIAAVIGIGCLGWASTNQKKYPSGGWIDGDGVAICITPLAVSLVFNALVIGILFLRRVPIHPGICVALDLLLWLAFIVSSLFVTSSALDLTLYAADDVDPYMYNPDATSSGSNYHYGYTSSGSYYSYYTRGAYIYDPTTGTYVYQAAGAACSGWESCKQQNEVIAALKHRGKVEWVGAGASWACLLLHFVLFVWACVDTSRRNRSKTSGKARVLAEAIVQEMVEQGRLLPGNQAGAGAGVGGLAHPQRTYAPKGRFYGQGQRQPAQQQRASVQAQPQQAQVVRGPLAGLPEIREARTLEEV